MKEKYLNNTFGSEKINSSLMRKYYPIKSAQIPRSRALESSLIKSSPSRGSTKHRKGVIGYCLCVAIFKFQRKSRSFLEADRISGNRTHQHGQCFD